MLKVSTFYFDSKGRKKVYTTNNDTGMHEHLRSKGGRTFQHKEESPLYFCPGLPLDKPLHFVQELK